jgi:hypothetical protein
MAGFLGARVFTTFYPHTVVETGGIHFHHFWYGLAMMAAAGWLGIVSLNPTYQRIYALIFGIGGGLIGDEVGLLLTLGNYYSELTYVFGIATIVGTSILLLLFAYGGRLKEDVLELGRGERLFHIGVAIAGLSVLAFAFEAWLLGVCVFAAGVLLAIVGFRLHKRFSLHR